MVTVAGARRLAVLIDGDNIPPDLADEVFAKARDAGTVSIRRVYGSTAGIAGWRDAAARFDIGLREVPPGKNATDMKLAIDAMDILYRGKVEGFCIVSSDSDFAELARRLREDGVTVEGFGEGKAPSGFRRACDKFVTIGRSAPAVVDKAPSIHPQLEVATKAVAQPTPKTLGPSDWPNLLAQALLNLPPAKGQVKLGVLAQQLQLLDAQFSAKKYGNPSLPTLLVKSGLELKKVGVHWAVVLPTELLRAA